MSKSKRTHHEGSRAPIVPTPKGRLLIRTAGAVGVTAALATTAVAANWAAGEADGSHGYESDSAVAVRGVSQAYGNVIILKSGARYRTSPDDSSDANNVSGTVPKGKELLIDTPYISPTPYLSSNQADWVGFTLEGTKTDDFKSPEDRASVTVWANLPELENTGYAQVYPDRTQPGVPESALITEDGAVSIAGQVDPHAGTSVIEPAGDFQSVVKTPDSY